MERIRRARPNGKGGGSYVAAPLSSLSFIPTGCTLLNLVLGGGWPLGRIVNVVGDKAVGKTLLAIEAAANFHRTYPRGRIWYREAEAAYDKVYAESLGMPTSRVSYGKKKFDTVEDVFEDMQRRIAWAKEYKAPGLYIIDSLDALSDRKAMTRDIGDPGFHLEKPKLMSELFRKLVRDIEGAQICVMIISQVRDKIGVTFGRKTTRSGGTALNFYASQILYLSHIGQVDKTIKGQKRTIGVRIKAKCDKNKVGTGNRFCEFVLRFGYGVDNLRANLEWLAEIKRLDTAKLNKQQMMDLLSSEGGDAPQETEQRTDAAVKLAWQDIETSFAPKRHKYG